MIIKLSKIYQNKLNKYNHNFHYSFHEFLIQFFNKFNEF